MPNRHRELPPNLSRRKAKSSPRFSIIAFCEGKNTEPKYLDDFCKDYGNGLVSVISVSGVGVAQTVVNEAKKKLRQMKRAKKNSFEEYDQCWAIFDHDNHPNVEQCVSDAKAFGVRVAFSNPCVELWAILHFADYGRVANGEDLRNTLVKFMPKYDANGSKIFDYQMMRTGYKEAVRRASMLLREIEKTGIPHGNPSTSFFELTQTIIENSGSKKIVRR